MVTRPVLVVVLRPKMLFFGDDTLSRRRFVPETSTFWRRNSFSSPFWDRKRYFLATTLILVAFFAPEPPLFGDDTLSRRLFCAEISTFWRRDSFSSSFLCGNLHFLATKLFLVAFLGPETLFFGDDTHSRRLFCTGTSTFWRRDPFSSSLLDGEPTFLATKPLLVVVFAPKTPFFGDETPYCRRFCAENSLFWRRHPFSSSFLRRKLLFLAT
ncbi:hypothetical protein LIZ76_17760, partial [Caldibacillus sp. 210928-DFI.2.22]|uniref:hypothetical protein n=1 Tax=Caldibacillus sp. 210928-DFI.2.22 TaxID=2883265 RepID=UPI001D06AD9C